MRNKSLTSLARTRENIFLYYPLKYLYIFKTTNSPFTAVSLEDFS